MERFALKTNMYLAGGGGRFLRQRVAEAFGGSNSETADGRAQGRQRIARPLTVRDVGA